ncbi:MAG: DNA/RNA non-specific endonuclease [Candidatus Omnitrophica bacterium]|nr:DNA/RNA non-specific endonuclease [Candidatus Omnitrophota bacterium]
MLAYEIHRKSRLCVTIILTCLFALQSLPLDFILTKAEAQEVSDALSPELSLTCPEFQEKVIVLEALIARRDIHEFILTYLHKVFKQYPDEMSDLSHHNHKGGKHRIERVTIKPNGKEQIIEIQIVGIPGLFKNWGIFGIIFIEKWSDIPVIYVDGAYFNFERNVLKNEIDEIAKWETRRIEFEKKQGEKIPTYAEYRKELNKLGSGNELREEYYGSMVGIAEIYAESEEKKPADEDKREDNSTYIAVKPVDNVPAVLERKSFSKSLITMIVTFISALRSIAEMPFGYPVNKLGEVAGTILTNRTYEVSYNPKVRGANWTVEDLLSKNLDKTKPQFKRMNNFRADARVSKPRAELADFKGSGYDRGHLAAAANHSWWKEALSETFFLTNIVPMDPKFNRGDWGKLEAWVRKLAAGRKKIHVITGTLYLDDAGKRTDKYLTIGKDEVAVPSHLYKIIMIPPGSGIKDGKWTSISFILRNTTDEQSDLSGTVTTIRNIEKLSGLDFFPKMEVKEQEKLENEKGDPEKIMVGDIDSVVDANEGNVTCGTICQSGHQEKLDPIIKEFYEKLAVKGGITRDLEKDQITSDEVIKILSEKMGFSQSLLKNVRSHIWNKLPELKNRGIEILFAMPDIDDRKKKLWWIDEEESGSQNSEIKKLYAGGHFNGAKTRIHISLPLIFVQSDIKEAALNIVRHEYEHICGKEVSHDPAKDRGMKIVYKTAQQEIKNQNPVALKENATGIKPVEPFKHSKSISEILEEAVTNPKSKFTPEEYLEKLRFNSWHYGAEIDVSLDDNITEDDVIAFCEYVRLNRDIPLSENTRRKYFSLYLANVVVCTLGITEYETVGDIAVAFIEKIEGHNRYKTILAKTIIENYPERPVLEEIRGLYERVHSAFLRNGTNTEWLDDFGAKIMWIQQKNTILKSEVETTSDELPSVTESLVDLETNKLTGFRADLNRLKEYLNRKIQKGNELTELFHRAQIAFLASYKLSFKEPALDKEIAELALEFVLLLKEKRSKELKLLVDYFMVIDCAGDILYTEKRLEESWMCANFLISEYESLGLIKPNYYLNSIYASTLFRKADIARRIFRIDRCIECAKEARKAFKPLMNNVNSVRDHKVFGDYERLLKCELGAYVSMTDWQRVKSVLEELALMVSMPNRATKDLSNIVFLCVTAAAAEFHLMACYRDRDCAKEMKRYADVINFLIPGDKDGAVISAIGEFVDGNYSDAEKILLELDPVGINHQLQQVYLRIMRFLASRANSAGRKSDKETLIKWVKKLLSSSGELKKGHAAILIPIEILIKGYEEPISRMREEVEESIKTGQYVTERQLTFALLEIEHALQNGEAVETKGPDGELSKHAKNALLTFSNEHFSANVAALDSNWWDPKIWDRFAVIAKDLFDLKEERIPLDAAVNIMKLRIITRTPGKAPDELMNDINLILDDISTTVAELEKERNHSDKKRKKELAKEIERYKPFEEDTRAMAETIKEECSIYARISNVERLIFQRNFEEAEKEISGILAVTEDIGIVERCESIRSFIKCVEEADQLYLKQRFAAAVRLYDEAGSTLNDLELNEHPEFSRRRVNASVLLEASQFYEKGDIEKAISEAEKVDDGVSEAFKEIVRGLSGGKLTKEYLKNLAKRYPNDYKIIIAARSIRDRDRADKNKTVWIEKEVVSFEERLLSENRENIPNVARDILNLLRNNGYSKTVGALLLRSVERMLEFGLYHDARYFAGEGSDIIKKINPDMARKFDEAAITANAGVTGEHLKRTHGILDAEISALYFAKDRVRSNEGRSSKDTAYTFKELSVDGVTQKIILRGFGFEKVGTEGKEIMPVDTPASVGATFALLVKDKDGKPVHYTITAVEVHKEYALFEIAHTPDKRKFLADVPKETGTITRIEDPSMPKRANYVYDCIANIERSIAEGLIPTTGHKLVDYVTGLAVPPMGTQTTAEIAFKDERVKNDASQRRAVEASLDRSQPIQLIQGPPGTGKTSVIVEMARQYYDRGLKVLIVSQSNQAVDNIGIRLCELQEKGDPLLFARLGNERSSVASKLHGIFNRKKDILQAMKDDRRKGAIVLGTTNGAFLDKAIDKDSFYNDGYDVVIVEEAGRATLDETLFPISKARSDGKVVLVGDHAQLPPHGLCVDKKSAVKELALRDYVPQFGLDYFRIADLDAQSKGNDSNYDRAVRKLNAILSAGRIDEYTTSPFEFLWERGIGFEPGVNKHYLKINRRSHPVIAKLVSILFYKGKIDVDPKKDPTPRADTYNLIDYASDEYIDHADREKEIYEEKSGTSFVNLREVNIVLNEADRILNQHPEYTMRDITVITPFKPQRSLIFSAFELKSIMNALKDGTDFVLTPVQISIVKGWISSSLDEKQKDIMISKLGAIDKEDEQGRAELIAGLESSFTIDIKKHHGPLSLKLPDLKEINVKELETLDVETVDSIQGAENKAVIVSLVRSNRSGEIGFLGNQNGIQRLCVAFSRAKEVFTVIGDFTHTLTKARYTKEARTSRAQKARETLYRSQGIFKKMVEYNNSDELILARAKKETSPHEQPSEKNIRQELVDGIKRTAADAVSGFFNAAFMTSDKMKDSQKILFAIDEDLGREWTEIFVHQIIKDICDPKESEIIKKKLSNIIFVKGHGKDLAEEVERYTGQGKDGIKIKKENVAVLMSAKNEACVNALSGAIITFVDDSNLDATDHDYFPFIELAFFTLAKALYNMGVAEYDKDKLDYIYRNIISKSIEDDKLLPALIDSRVVTLTLRHMTSLNYEELKDVHKTLRGFLQAA